MAASAFRVFEEFKLQVGKGVHDLSSDTLKVALFAAAYNPNLDTNDVLATIVGDEVSGGGYTRATLTSVTWAVQSSGIVRLDSADFSFAASGADITYEALVLFNDTPTSPADPLIGYWYADATPATKTITDGDTHTFELPANGIMRITGATS